MRQSGLDRHRGQVVLDSVPKVVQQPLDPIHGYTDAASFPPSDGGLLHAELFCQFPLRQAGIFAQLLEHQSDVPSFSHNTSCYQAVGITAAACP